MPHTKSVLKASRQNRKRRVRNQGIRTRYRSAVKRVHTALEEGDHPGSQDALAHAVQVIARTRSKGVIHRQTASRMISRISRRVHALQQKPSDS